MDSQDIAILCRAKWNLKQGIKTLIKENSSNEGRAEELGRLVGLYYRASEKLAPWPGQRIITNEIREIGQKYNLDISWACWNPGVYDDGTNGIPYVYIYFRSEANDEAMKAFCKEVDITFYGFEDEEGGLFVISGEAVGGRWEKWWLESQGVYI